VASRGSARQRRTGRPHQVRMTSSITTRSRLGNAPSDALRVSCTATTAATSSDTGNPHRRNSLHRRGATTVRSTNGSTRRSFSGSPSGALLCPGHLGCGRLSRAMIVALADADAPRAVAHAAAGGRWAAPFRTDLDRPFGPASRRRYPAGKRGRCRGFFGFGDSPWPARIAACGVCSRLSRGAP
jgi:hypothetical protein